ncbi:MULTISPECIES: CPXCG motif-containing cysteine-rich protein [Cyclobacterium]|uniref:CPXCG motif-containing cysteine-rich protein n=1 Tax=Cyclobacterium plantarum TaxID=2716263 RepID=A0ABX0HI19_9BACT|nr:MULTISPECIES: CPXCG motif-containing cysteine-rich protein [Cyclobacterium]MBD3631227.1 CPXCG motif-containing cysteine-rich protein [Cyclobacterium sp.]NHE59690.1 CPXCG motif-containing cysteine-rich protein [Cyclobacterium plantarum]
MEIEHYFQCPYCLAEISMLLDPSVTEQEYIEDCEICCNPIQVAYGIENGELHWFNASGIEQ